MARAPETGFYFEPLTERFALVVEGSPFPSDDHWAFIGDPIEVRAHHFGGLTSAHIDGFRK